MNGSRRLLRAVLIIAILSVIAAPSFSAAPDPTVDSSLESGADAGQQWKVKLGLSDAQARKFTILEKERAARLKPLRELLRNGMVKLQAQLAESAPEADVQDSLRQIVETRKAIADHGEKFDDALASFLSPSQRARLLVWRSLGGLNGYAARRLETAVRQEPREEDPERE